MRAWPLALAACSGAVAEHPKAGVEASGFAPAAALMADSASLCWQRFSRGVSIEASCTSLGVSMRVDTIRDTVRVPTPMPEVVTQRFPVGPYDLFQSWERAAETGFTGAVLYTNPNNVLRTLRGLRANQVRAILKLTGEPHSDPDGTDAYRTKGKFDFQKWKDSTARYLPVRDSIAQAVAEGWVLGYSMIDEPNHPTWGNALTKATLDSMAAFSQSLFPGLPTGAAVPYGWKPDQSYQVLDFIIAQTWKPSITPDSFRTAAVAAARKNGVALVLSMNLMGMAVVGDCERRPTGKECYMTPDQVRLWGMTLGAEPYACGLTMWRYDRSLWSRPAYRRAIQDVAALVSQRRAKSCRRG